MLRTNKRGGRRTSEFELKFLRFQFAQSAAMRANFYEQMASLIRDGKPLDSSLRTIYERLKLKNRPLAPLYAGWVSSLDEGKTFGEAMRGYASETEIIILSAGEKSGELANAFDQAAMVASSGAEMSKAIKGEMATPAIQIIVLLGVLIGFSTKVAPDLARSVPMSAFDDSQRALFALASFVANVWWFVIPILIGVVALSVWSLPRWTSKIRNRLEVLPPWSIYKVYASSTFMIALSSLIRAGIPIEAAIRFISRNSGPWMKEHLGTMVGRLQSGVDQGDALDVGLLSDQLADLTAIYAKTSDFESAINSVGRRSIQTGIEEIKAKASKTKVICTLLIGLQVGWMVDAMMSIGDAATRASRQAQTVRAAN